MAEEKAEEKSASVKPTSDKEEKEKEIKVPEKFKKLVEEIEKMAVSDLAELVKVLEKKFGVQAQAQAMAPPAAGVAAGAVGSQADIAEQKTEFNVTLKEIGEKKIEVIKLVRDITGKGLKEAKDLVDAVEKEPQLIKENVKKEEAEELKKKLEVAGAKVELK